MNSPVNILIVDDEPKNLTVLETILNGPGYRLVRAESADQALLALVREEFALLILDIRMPGMTGFELAQMIKDRKKTSSVPIIFLTAYYNEDQHALEGYSSGAVDYLHKPVNPTILRSKVAVFTELYRATREIGIANRSLLCEMTERYRVEEQLRELNETLEQRVVERTESLRENEHFLQRITDVTPGMIYIFDANDQRMVFVNRSVSTFLGYSGDDLLAMGTEVMRNLMHPEDLPRFEQHWIRARALADGEIADFEHRLRDQSGEWHWFHNRDGVFARDANGCARQIIGTAIEITDRKRVEAAMVASDRRKDEFLATLAHELRNPLAPVRSAVQVLHMKEFSHLPELQGSIEVIDRQTLAMSRLIDDLMDICRINQGKIELRRELIELAEVVQRAVETSQPLIDECGHHLTVTLPSNPLIIHADEVRLTQVLLNLLNNAAKYTERGGRIDLMAEQQGGDVVVTVTDNGIGIPNEKLPAIFDMFSQVQSALSRSQGGLGIGLSLVKRLVELHDGMIEAHSAGLGCGSKFIVRLPVVAERKSPDTSLASVASTTPTSNLRILVVDDNRDAATTSSMLLRLMGNKVHTAHDGEEAVEAAGVFRPHVVLCDIGLPKLNGYDTCRQMRERAWDKNMILIAVTGWGQDHDKRMSVDAGFDHHMVKPVDMRALMKMLEELHIDNHELQ